MCIRDRPITTLLKGFPSTSTARLPKGVWSEDQQKSFDTLKKLLLSEPILRLYNPEAETFLEVDASAFALGSILKQIDPETKQIYTIGYFSEKLPTTKNT